MNIIGWNARLRDVMEAYRLAILRGESVEPLQKDLKRMALELPPIVCRKCKRDVTGERYWHIHSSGKPRNYAVCMACHKAAPNSVVKEIKP